METALHSKGPINEATTLAQIKEKYPELRETLSNAGIDPDQALWESLGERKEKGGLSDSDFDALLQELNTSAAGSAPDTLVVTSSAAKKGRELLEKEESASGKGLRIKIVPGGCSGFSYQFLFDGRGDDDVIIEQEGLQVFVDRQSLDLIKGSTLDYSESLNEAGFKVSNPNAKGGCGCGESFNV